MTPCREKKNAYRYQSQSPPPFFKNGHAMGKNMAGTNEFAFFRCGSMCTGGGGGVQNQAKKKKSKNAFWPVPVPKYLLFQPWAFLLRRGEWGKKNQ